MTLFGVPAAATAASGGGGGFSLGSSGANDPSMEKSLGTWACIQMEYVVRLIFEANDSFYSRNTLWKWITILLFCSICARFLYRPND